MSSSNNDEKNDDDGGKKEPSDTLDNGVYDEKNPPALSTLQEGTHCGGDESSFLAEKRLIAGRSRAPRKMEKKLAHRFLEKNDPDSSSFGVSANMSDSSNVALQAKQESVCRSSFAEEIEREELEAAALEDLTAMPQDAKNSRKEMSFAEEVKVEDQDQEATTLQESSAVPQGDNHFSENLVPVHEVMAAASH